MGSYTLCINMYEWPFDPTNEVLLTAIILWKINEAKSSPMVYRKGGYRKGG